MPGRTADGCSQNPPACGVDSSGSWRACTAGGRRPGVDLSVVAPTLQPLRDPTTVHRRLRDAHAETLAATVDAGRAVASTWDADAVEDSTRITEPLETQLRERGLDAALLELLATGADALDTSIQGDPVTAPPYLSITGRGPVLRATLADGPRLVATVGLFAVERRPARYRFRDPDPAACLEVEVRDER